MIRKVFLSAPVVSLSGPKGDTLALSEPTWNILDKILSKCFIPRHLVKMLPSETFGQNAFPSETFDIFFSFSFRSIPGRGGGGVGCSKDSVEFQKLQKREVGKRPHPVLSSSSYHHHHHRRHHHHHHQSSSS